MRSFKYIGDPRNDGEGPKTVTFNVGKEGVAKPFTLNLGGAPVEVPDSLAEKLANNTHFEEAKKTAKKTG